MNLSEILKSVMIKKQYSKAEMAKQTTLHVKTIDKILKNENVSDKIIAIVVYTLNLDNKILDYYGIDFEVSEQYIKELKEKHKKIKFHTKKITPQQIEQERKDNKMIKDNSRKIRIANALIREFFREIRGVP